MSSWIVEERLGVPIFLEKTKAQPKKSSFPHRAVPPSLYELFRGEVAIMMA